MSRSRSVSSACSIKFRAAQCCGIKTMGRVPRLALERGRYQGEPEHYLPHRTQGTEKREGPALYPDEQNRQPYPSASRVIWSLHRMQPVIWSHHRIQRLDRLNCSPGSRAAASSFFGAGGDFKMKSWVADRGLVGSNMGRRSASCPRTGTLLARAGPASRFSPGKLHCTAWTPPALPRLTTMPRSPHSWVQGVSPDHNRRSHGRNLNTTIGSASVEFDRPSRIAGKPA